MPAELFEYLASDHERLERLLDHAVSDTERIEMSSYEEFRKGLLRHISIEEKILLPAIARKQDGKPSADAERIRLDHGALAALLVPPPSVSIIKTIRSILAVHNALEEREGGIYSVLERLAGSEADKILGMTKTAPQVPVMPFNNRPDVLQATRRALARAGYEMK